MFGKLVALLAAPLVLGAPLAAQHLVFGAPRAADVADTAFGIRTAVGDVTGDLMPDVIAASSANGVFELLVNDGTGKLLDGVTIASGSAHELHLVDVNDDGNLDLFAADGAIDVRLGAGGGAFGPPQYLFDYNAHTCQMHLADVTGDDLTDVVAVSGTNFIDARVDVLPGLGDGSFGPATFGDGLFTLLPMSVDAGDLNEDGNVDLVIAGLEGGGGAGAKIFFGTGGGAFSAPTSLGGASRARIALLDDDEHLDLVLEGGFGLLGRVLGAGDGTFAPVSLFGSQVFPATNIALADFDLDGHIDVATLDQVVEELLTWRGTSDGLPSASTRVTLFRDAGGDLQAADFDGDGRDDLVLSGPALSDTVVVLLNHSYRPGDPWTDLGFSKPENQVAVSNPLGLNHRPILWAEGTLEAGSPVTLHIVRNGVWTVKAFLILGFSEIYGPLKGGTLVPSADLLIGPVFANQNGEFPLTGTMPAGVPAGSTFAVQAWFYPSQPPGATQYAGTSGVRATTP